MQGVYPGVPQCFQLGGLTQSFTYTPALIAPHPRGSHNLSPLFTPAGVWWLPQTWAGLTAW